MTWLKLSDDFGDQVAGLSDAAFRTHVEGLLWAMRRENGGAVTPRDLRRFSEVEDPDAAVAELVAFGAWTVQDDGWQIEHHMDEQPDVATLQARRAAAAERQARRRRQLAGLDAPPDASSSRGESRRESRRDSPRDDTRDPGRDGAGLGEQVTSRSTEERGGPSRGESRRDGPFARPFPDQCGRHQDEHNEQPCRPCGDQRQANARAAEEAAEAARQPPPWCGDCEPDTRLREVNDAVQRCPACHPLVTA